MLKPNRHLLNAYYCNTKINVLIKRTATGYFFMTAEQHSMRQVYVQFFEKLTNVKIASRH